MKYDAFNPIVGQQLLIDQIKNKGVDLVNATSPFMMLVEAASVSTSAAMDAMIRNDRKIYPYLARSDDDLYHHMTTDEEQHMYATPARTTFRLYIQLNDIISYGKDIPNNGKYLVIAADTVIDIAGYDFRIQYDIHVKLVDKTPFVYQDVESNRDGIATSNVVIRSGTVKLENGVDWVVFDIDTTQVSLLENTLSLVRGVRMTKRIQLPKDDQYFRSVCYYNTPDGRVYLDVVHLDTAINTDRPTINCRIKDGVIEYNIPSYYIEHGFIPTNVYIKTYTTRGKMYFNIPTDVIDVKIDRSGVNSDSELKAAGNKINIIPELMDPIDGGTDMRNFRVRREKVIHNTTGVNELPITEKELLEAGRTDGFKLNIVKDTILGRVILASKTDYKNIYKGSLVPDILFNNISFSIADISNTPITIEDDIILIPSNTLFRYNGNFIPLTISEVEDLKSKSKTDRILYYRDNVILSSMYTYSIYTDINTNSCEVYDIEIPTVSDSYINSVNMNVSERVSTYKPLITSNKNGYTIKTKLLVDNTKNPEKIDSIKSKLSIPIYGTKNNIYIDGVLGDDNVITFEIESTRRPKKNTIEIIGTDVYGDYISGWVDLDSTIGLIHYTDNSKLIDDQYTTTLYPLLNKTSVALTLEYIYTSFGTALEYVHNNMKTGFTNRKYSTYPVDIVDTYSEDIYKEVDGSEVILTYDENNQVVDAGVETLHRRGDIKYEVERNASGDPIIINSETVPIYKTDSEGNIMTETVIENGIETIVNVRQPIYKHRKGDIIYDTDNKPKIDKIGGVLYNFNMLMMDSMFLYTDSYDKSLIDFKKSLVTKWVTKDINRLNDIVLEHSRILLHPIKNTGPVYISGSRVVSHIVKPSIILHVRNKLDVSLAIDDLIREIGVIFSRFVSKNIVELNTIRDTIMKDIPGNIAGVTINMNDGLNLEVYTLEDNSNRMSIAYSLNNHGNIVYDLDVAVEIA